MYSKCHLFGYLIGVFASAFGTKLHAESLPPPATDRRVDKVSDDMCCKGCAQKIAEQLYAIKGITKVSVDLQQEVPFVETRPVATLSPWRVDAAIAQAKERPLAIHGPHSTLAIGWATKRAPKNHQQAQQSSIGGIQR